MTVQPSPADFALALDQLQLGRRGRVSAIDWTLLGTQDAARLRHFGFDASAVVGAIRPGPLADGAIRCTVNGTLRQEARLSEMIWPVLLRM